MRKFTFGLKIAKNTDYIEKCFKQKLSRTKFPLKKPLCRHISIYPSSGARSLQRFAFKFTLGLEAAKNTDYIKKYFKQKLRRIKFPKKNSADAYFYLPQELEPEGFKELAI